MIIIKCKLYKLKISLGKLEKKILCRWSYTFCTRFFQATLKHVSSLKIIELHKSNIFDKIKVQKCQILLY